MKQTWLKLGQIFSVDNLSEYLISHAAVPTAEPIGEGVYRIYFGSRNVDNQAHIAQFDLDLNNPTEIKNLVKEPSLYPGELGTFDDSGILPSWVVNHDNKRYMYYCGVNVGVTVPFRNMIGLAIANEGEHEFKRYTPAPLVPRDRIDPLFFTNPCVLKEDDKWRMWYLSATKWIKTEHGPKHFYHIKYDESADGLNWNRKTSVAIDFKYDNEYAISRPCVLKDDDLYRMWFSFRGGPDHDTYRIGYAESTDGIQWERKDELVDFTVSEEGWDSEMVEYPCVIKHNDTFYMLYNGNGYGRSGIGIAVMEK